MKTEFPAQSLIILCVVLVSFPAVCAAQPILIDHTCTDIGKIPVVWLEQAKLLAIHYAHTSHGSQINSGAENLESQDAKYSFARRESTTAGLPPVEVPPALRMYDGNPPETYIEPDDYWNGVSGRNRTRAVAGTGVYNFSMWAWCGQLSSESAAYVQNYLDTMNQFETEYPAMRFIYMTGHLNGTGSAGDLHLRNQMIRTYCTTNNKVLFDFADIERYDPDGTDYLDLNADDNCDYSGGNWAEQWCAANPGSDLCANCYCEHSQSLNCNLKGRAFWWMMARLAGWSGATVDAEFTASPRRGAAPLTVVFSDQSVGAVSSWSWDFGDGHGSPLQNPTHVYDTPGSYTVALTVNPAAEEDTETKVNYITATGAPFRPNVFLPLLME